jgi:hypothetical protein
MNHDPDMLDHLITRELDGEITAAQRKALRRMLQDPAAAALFDDYRTVDQEAGAALRTALGRSPRVIRLRSSWERIGRAALVATAAGLAAVVWLHPGWNTPTGPRTNDPLSRASAASWFVPPAPAGDAIEPPSTAYERPEVRVRGTQREWIVIPGDRPGTMLVIEVDRVRTHVMAVHEDF